MSNWLSRNLCEFKSCVCGKATTHSYLLISSSIGSCFVSVIAQRKDVSTPILFFLLCGIRENSRLIALPLEKDSHRQLEGYRQSLDIAAPAKIDIQIYVFFFFCFFRSILFFFVFFFLQFMIRLPCSFLMIQLLSTFLIYNIIIM